MLSSFRNNTLSMITRHNVSNSIHNISTGGFRRARKLQSYSVRSRPNTENITFQNIVRYKRSSITIYGHNYSNGSEGGKSGRKVGVDFASNSAERSFTTNKTDLPSPSSPEKNWERSVSVDNDELFNPNVHLQDMPNFRDPSLNYEDRTPLSDAIIKIIGLRGPITTARYMGMALTDPNYGYYTSKESNKYPLEEDLFNDDIDLEEFLDKADSAGEVIGEKGDFTTAPEISQIFGECILLFYVNQFRNVMKSPAAIQLIEIGPGRGTLMADILNAACGSFPDFVEALSDGGGIHFIEVSEEMRKKQMDAMIQLQEKLNTSDSVKCDVEFSFHQSKSDSADKDDVAASTPPSLASKKSNGRIRKMVRVRWHNHLSFVPPNDVNGKRVPHFILCQEFLDALPIHSFQKHEDGSWRERMVDVAVSDESSDEDGTGSLIFERERMLLEAMPDQNKKPRLRFVLSKGDTLATQKLLKLSDEQRESSGIGDVIEVCPDAMVMAQDMAARVSVAGGAALVVDYGTEYPTGDTLRGYYKHRQVHPLSLPGRVDVTADVVFGALRQEIEKIVADGKGKDDDFAALSCHGPVTQGQFLHNLGATERVMDLISQDDTTDEQAEELYNGMMRLMSPEEMGERYKVLGIVSKGDDDVFEKEVPPPGFYVDG